MTDREAIEHLKTTTPTVQLTVGQRAARIVGWVCSGIAIMALTVSVYATRQASLVSSCINSTLGVRQQFSDADHANERQKIADQAVAETDKAKGLTQLQLAKTRKDALAGFVLYQQGVNEFVQSLKDWTARDKAITAQRSRHPLGRC